MLGITADRSGSPLDSSPCLQDKSSGRILTVQLLSRNPKPLAPGKGASDAGINRLRNLPSRAQWMCVAGEQDAGPGGGWPRCPGADCKMPSEKAPQAAEGAAKARQGWGWSGFLGRPCWGQVEHGTANTGRKAWNRVGCPPAIRGGRQHGHLCLSALWACALPACSLPLCGQQPWHLHPLASGRFHPVGAHAGDVRGTHRRNTGV